VQKRTNIKNIAAYSLKHLKEMLTPSHERCYCAAGWLVLGRGVVGGIKCLEGPLRRQTNDVGGSELIVDPTVVLV
jgi:hypothetical protein